MKNIKEKPPELHISDYEDEWNRALPHNCKFENCARAAFKQDKKGNWICESHLNGPTHKKYRTLSSVV